MRISAINTIPFLQLKTHYDGQHHIIDKHYHSVRGSEEAYSSNISRSILPNNYKLTYIHAEDEFLPDASETLKFIPDNKTIKVDMMKTKEEKRGLGLGISMHLLNVIELLENDYDSLTLYSISSAVPFHAKLGFKPNAQRWQDNLYSNIKAISEETDTRLREYADRAKVLLLYNDESKVASGNMLLTEYLRAATKIKSKSELENLLPIGIDMKLSKSCILKHKKFYNKMFDKYDIDYKIN